MAATVYWYGPRVILASLGARELQLAEAPALHSTVERLALLARIERPKLYLVPDGHPRALSVGRAGSSGIALTQGLVTLLSPAELEGVLAHELAHARHRDVLIQTPVVLIANWLVEASRIGGFLERGLLFVLGPVAASIVQVFLSPRRELHADLRAADSAPRHIRSRTRSSASSRLRSSSASRGARSSSPSTSSTRSSRLVWRGCSRHILRSASGWRASAHSIRSGARSSARPSRSDSRRVPRPVMRLPSLSRGGQRRTMTRRRWRLFAQLSAGAILLAGVTAGVAGADSFPAWSGTNGPFQWHAKRDGCGVVGHTPSTILAHTRWRSSPANGYVRLTFMRQIRGAPAPGRPFTVSAGRRRTPRSRASAASFTGRSGSSPSRTRAAPRPGTPSSSSGSATGLAATPRAQAGADLRALRRRAVGPKKGAASRRPFQEKPAATYSPGRLPSEYHRRGRA